MSRRRPRSVAIPLAATALVLAALVLALAPRDERVVIRITSPSGPRPLRLKAGSTCLVEGVVDSGNATYAVPGMVLIEVSYRDGEYGKVILGSLVAKYDRASRRFSGTITPAGPWRKQRDCFLGVFAIDQVGRHHGSDPGAPDESLIPVVIE